MLPILIYENIFEPSYNDLKFMVQNCSYVFTNLIKGLPLLQASRQLFAGQMLPQPAGDRRCFPRKSSSNPEAQIFMLQE